MSESFELEAPDHFTAGAIGPPGERVFYLQARQGTTVVTLKCEKEHVRALGNYFNSTLAKLPAPADAVGEAELLEFVEPNWIVAALGAGWDMQRERFIVELKELVEEEQAEPGAEQDLMVEREPSIVEETAISEEAATGRIWITRGQAAAFVERAEALMKAGRPICPVCSQPKDPSGHICPRSNGHMTPPHVAG
jgi:uncharacterized repeat protein (TIGR03847 family)